ncbi:Putative ribonuclease H protein At1g65750 [Linum perenne]
MQTSLLPGYVCEKIDQRIRDFVWGSDQGKRKIHLVNWDTICKPKDLGGLGLRSARHLNQAFLLKIAWGLLKRPSELWADLLLTKYMKKSGNGLVARGTKRFSNLWRGIKEVWPFLNLGLQWGNGNGRDTKFWTDRWLDSGQLLIDTMPASSNLDIHEKVVDFVKPNGAMANLGQDTPVWGLEGSGVYSVKTGYSIIHGLESDSDMERRKWKTIWSWPGPNKIRHFMWLVAHNRLMTNEERARRHLTSSSECGSCAGVVESIDHVLRGCFIAREVWRKTLSRSHEPSFFSAPFQSWWDSNIQNSEGQTTFGITCWIIWRSRNERLFQNSIASADVIAATVRYWQNTVITAQAAAAQTRCLNSSTREVHHVCWNPAPDPWITLNTDGSLMSTGSAGAGGVLRMNDGQVIHAFSANLGGCSITRAEMRAIVEGTTMAWDLGIRKLAIQTDSIAAVRILQDRSRQDHQHANLARRFQELVGWDWEVSLIHVYREGNCPADYLASLGYGYPFGCHMISVTNCNLAYFLRFDCFGITTPRHVIIND